MISYISCFIKKLLYLQFHYNFKTFCYLINLCVTEKQRSSWRGSRSVNPIQSRQQIMPFTPLAAPPDSKSYLITHGYTEKIRKQVEKPLSKAFCILFSFRLSFIWLKSILILCSLNTKLKTKNNRLKQVNIQNALVLSAVPYKITQRELNCLVLSGLPYINVNFKEFFNAL